MDRLDSKVEQPTQDAQFFVTENDAAVATTPSTSLATVTSYSCPMRVDPSITRVLTQTEITRIQTQRSQHGQTVGSSSRLEHILPSSKPVLPAFGGGKPYPSPLPDQEAYVVEFDGENDPLHGQNWSRNKK
jgi:DHA1 family multidrug resistance protein-like MFS transporter